MSVARAVVKISPSVILFSLMFLISCSEDRKNRVLVFSKTASFRHESIAEGKKMFLELGIEHSLQIDTTEDAGFFHDTTLVRYDAVVFLNTTGDVLDSAQQLAFERFIRSGKGFVGIHSASDTEYQWPWYGQLVGAYFKGHPQVQRALFKKTSDSALTDGLPQDWYRTDEEYNFQQIPQNVQVIYQLIENSYEGGEHPDNHPIAWYHEYDGGRSFYTGMGHTKESYTDPFFQKHILLAIHYAIGRDH